MSEIIIDMLSVPKWIDTPANADLSRLVWMSAPGYSFAGTSVGGCKKIDRGTYSIDFTPEHYWSRTLAQEEIDMWNPASCNCDWCKTE